METPAQYFRRMKSETQRSLQRMGHPTTSQTLSSSRGSIERSTPMQGIPARSRLISEHRSLAS